MTVSKVHSWGKLSIKFQTNIFICLEFKNLETCQNHFNTFILIFLNAIPFSQSCKPILPLVALPNEGNFFKLVDATNVAQRSLFMVSWAVSMPFSQKVITPFF